MAMTPAIEHPTTFADGRGTPYHYSLFGLRMQSDIRLPIPADPPGAYRDPDIVVALGGFDDGSHVTGKLVAEMRCQCPSHAGRVVMRVYRDADGAWIWNDAAGLCRVASNGRDVDVYRAAAGDNDDRRIGFVLASVASTLALHFRGYSSLHASAVATPEGAIAFLGPKGQGKTTMAAGFIRRGAALVTDDILPLHARADGVYGLPSLPIMKLWDQSVVHGLAIDDDLPNLLPEIDKKLFTLDRRFAFASDPVRLGAIYVLNRYDPVEAQRNDVVIDPIPARNAVAALMTHSSLREYLLPAEMATLLQRYAGLLSTVPVRLVQYPNGFEHQDAVHDQITQDLKARR